jgi:hypothetical protein
MNPFVIFPKDPAVSHLLNDLRGRTEELAAGARIAPAYFNEIEVEPGQIIKARAPSRIRYKDI